MIFLPFGVYPLKTYSWKPFINLVGIGFELVFCNWKFFWTWVLYVCKVFLYVCLYQIQSNSFAFQLVFLSYVVPFCNCPWIEHSQKVNPPLLPLILCVCVTRQQPLTRNLLSALLGYWFSHLYVLILIFHRLLYYM